MRRLIPIVWLACGLTTTNCASRPALPAAPRLEMPVEARRPCELYRLPESTNLADLEIGYATRGAQIVACDGARSLAIETFDGEHRLEDKALRKTR